MDRHVCIHGHFYQPPRENAWLEAVEMQASAYPYHDWNEKVTAECYLPNSASRILDGHNCIAAIVNNYARISFDFGPTLLSWLETNASDVYAAILDADKQSQVTFSGHGSAMAQAYNHLIMPLANRHDKYTQAFWGIRDFEHRFGRRPEGMWLPETAVDLETLDIMAQMGVKFTILAPRQAARVRLIGEEAWQDISGELIDTTMPYEIALSSGRKLAIFFYNGVVAQAVAFQGLLKNGENFALDLVGSPTENGDGPQLAHIATDGESYGHHHRFGDMALSYALQYIEDRRLAQLTNYGEFLEKRPPAYEVEILENTSWSCAHGVERWRSDCGCSDHYHPGWNQAWRTPLREAMDWLRDEIAPEFEKKAGTLFKEPWQARDDYIDVILDRSPQNVASFLGKHAHRNLTPCETITALKLMELQRHAMLMYTSCGWFFDDIARIESVQAIQYAGRAAQLAQELFGDSTEAAFLARLAKATSNRKEFGSGKQIYERFVRPAFTDLKTVAAHFAVSSFFEHHAETTHIYGYEVHSHDLVRQECGRNKVLAGQMDVRSLVTTEALSTGFVALLREDNTVTAGIGPTQATDTYRRTVDEISSACSLDDAAWIEQFLTANFGGSLFTINSLFRDARDRMLESVLDSMLEEIKRLFHSGLQSYSLVTPFVDDISSPLPETFHPLVELVANLDLRHHLKADKLDVKAIDKILSDVRVWRVHLDGGRLGLTFGKTIENTMRRLAAHPQDTAVMDTLAEMTGLAGTLPFPTDLQVAQNLYYRLLKTTYPDYREKAGAGDMAAADWAGKFTSLGERLSIKLD